MAALLRQGARRLGGSMLRRTHASVTSPALAEERRRLLPGRMLYTQKAFFFGNTEQHAPEDITRNIQRKQRELCDEIAKGKRSLEAASDWRTQQKLFDAIAEARWRLRAATNWCDEDLQEHFRRPKPLEKFLELIVLFLQAAAIFIEISFFGFMIYVVVSIVSSLREEAKKEREEAGKKREQ